jgi:hypothetical protein
MAAVRTKWTWAHRSLRGRRARHAHTCLMHGNREASEVDGELLREGQQATIRRGSEESDAGMVPKKPAKTWVTPVESVEGRAAAEGKSAHGDARRAQDRERAPTQVERIGQRAKEKKGERFERPLRVELVFPERPEPVLADLPFELLADADGFLFRRVGHTLVRTLRGFRGENANLGPGTRVLCAWANPVVENPRGDWEALPASVFCG